MHIRSFSLKSLVPVLILLVAISGLFGFVATKPAPTSVEVKEKAWPVAVETMVSGSYTPTLTVYGWIESPRESELTSTITADVINILVKEGQDVSKDQLLVSLDDKDSALLVEQRQAEVAEIKAQIASEKNRHKNDLVDLGNEKELLALSQKALKRAKSLESGKLTSQSLIDDARQAVIRQELAVNTRQLAIEDHQSRLAQLTARLKRAVAQKELARRDFMRCKLRAPFAGRITKVSVSPGDQDRPGEKMIEMFDASDLQVRAQIPTQYLNQIQEAITSGRSVSAIGTVDNQYVELKLERMAGQVAKGSSGVNGLFSVLSGGDQLQLGRFVELTLKLPAISDVFALPQEAFYGTDRIYKVDDRRLSSITINRIGETHLPGTKTFQLVHSTQLQQGDRIVVTQLPNAIDGLLVDIVY